MNKVIELNNFDITNNTIIVDSINRDYTKYPNPFNFKINLNPNNNENFYITKNFKNVKLFNIKKIILPNLFYINTNIINIPFIDENLIIDYNNQFINTNYIENILLTTINFSYMIINAYKIIYDRIEFTLTYNFVTYNLTFIFNNFNSSKSYVIENNNYISTEIFNYLKSKLYNINSIKTFNNITITITNIINNYNTIYIYNFCKKLANINYLLNKIYYYEYNTLEDTTIRKEFILNQLKLENEKYLLIHIDEINNNEYFSSYQNNISSYSILRVNGEELSDKQFRTWYLESNKYFKNNDLGNITSLTFKILDSNGNLLFNSINNSHIDTYIDINKKYDNKYENFNYASQYVNFRHPYYYYFQITLILEIGNYEIELNKQMYNSNIPFKNY